MDAAPGQKMNVKKRPLMNEAFMLNKRVRI